MSLEITVLGSNSALFAYGRHLTSQLITCGKSHFLVDCGEGTQLQIAKFGIKPSKISHILISHLHGDHYFGLIGLLSSMHLLGRDKELNIYAPVGLSEIITTQFRYSQTALKFKVNFIELTSEDSEVIFENKSLSVFTIPLKHRLYTNGFLFKEKPKERRVNKEKLRPDFTIEQIKSLKKGQDIEGESGEVLFKNDDYTLDPKKAWSYAFCSDTAYTKETSTYVKGVDLLYHESTFGSNEQDRAEITLHSTAQQAAQVAKDAEVGMLMLGHYSTRYESIEYLLEEAREVFENTIPSVEGEKIILDD